MKKAQKLIAIFLFIIILLTIGVAIFMFILYGNKTFKEISFEPIDSFDIDDDFLNRTAWFTIRHIVVALSRHEIVNF